MLLVQSYGTNGTLYTLPALSYGYGYSPIQNYPTGYRTQREPRTLLVPQAVQLARASASALPRPGHGPQHLQKSTLGTRGHRQGGGEKCGECKMGRFPTCRGFSPAVKQKKVQKGWRSNVPCCNACSDNAWMHTTPRQLAAAYSIPCGAVLGARVALPATLELLARSNWGRIATASSRENASADTLWKSSM